MAQFRQSGAGNGSRNGVASDHISINMRSGGRHHHHRRSKALPAYKISVRFCVLTLFIILSISAFFYFLLQSKGVERSRHQVQDNDVDTDTDFLMNVTRIDKPKDLNFGHGLVDHGLDSRGWDKDDRRRDEDYLERAQEESVDDVQTTVNRDDESSSDKPHSVLDHRGNDLYNESGRHELKAYEAEDESSLKNAGESTLVHGKSNQQSGSVDERNRRELDDADDYDDGMDLQDDQMDVIEEADKASSVLHSDATLSDSEAQLHSGHAISGEGQPVRKLFPGKRSGSKKKSKHRKSPGTCEMKFMNSSALNVEPLESRKFARFSLRYTEREEKAMNDETWEPRFAGHQSLREREESFIAQDQTINCGFVKGPEGSPSTGFDLSEDDANYISSCHIAVSSCIFGNSDRLRSPMGKTVSRFSKKSVCFVMFVDEVTLQTLSSEGHMPDMMGFIGLWKIVVVKNFPSTDMRRVGKIPKLLPHRLFPSARYSIWLDSKLRLQLDPLLILEYFLWRKGYEYAISNHYDRHCLWEEVAQNKRLNKYNHSVIDEQFAFYQADGMRRFNTSDPNKLLPSNVPEGSFIIRAHTPMSNLFSCLWFNEVDRFTPRDQLSFAYTYHKLRRMNPDKPFYLNMFKDCERRKIAKLFRHRSEETRNSLRLAT